MILVGKAAARPAHHDMPELLDVLDELAPDAVDIGHLGVGADPDAVVDHAADVFGKLAVEGRLDRADRLVQQNGDRELGGRARASAHDAGKPRDAARRRTGRRPAARSAARRWIESFCMSLFPRCYVPGSLFDGMPPSQHGSGTPGPGSIISLCPVSMQTPGPGGVSLMSRVVSSGRRSRLELLALVLPAVAISMCAASASAQAPERRASPSSPMWCCAVEP